MAANDYDVVFDEGIEAPLDEGQVRACLDAALAAEGVGRPCMASVSFVSEARIAELNEAWRGQARPTDVISLECERPDDPELAPGEPCELGDIVLAPGYIARQAADYGTTEADECRLLLVHGALHLLGYDHLDEGEAERMEARESAILETVPGDGTITDVVLTRHREEDA